MTCWLRLRDGQAAQVWHNLHLLLLDELRSADKLDFSRGSIDRASVPSPREARARTPIPRTEEYLEASAIASRTAKVSR